MYEGDTIDYFALANTTDPEAPDAGRVEQSLVGAEISGFYLESELGRGGQGTLYLARRAGSSYVVKVYYPGYLPLAEAIELLSRNECEYLAELVATGAHEGQHYEIYPYYGSGSLADSPQRSQFLEVVVVPSLDKALHYLHRNGLIHADVKPANIFITEDRDKVVLGDLGVATTLEGRSARRMRFRGTLEFAPYCQHQGEWVSIEPAYDYGALGLTLVTAYTGVSLFAGLTLDERDARWLNDVALPPNIPPRARALIDGLVQRDPQLRWSHREVEQWYTPASSRTRRWNGVVSTSIPRRVRGLDFGFFDGVGLIPESLAELDDAIERHWDAGIALLDTDRLRVFLHQFESGRLAYANSREAIPGEAPDLRLYRLIATIRRDDPENRRIRYRGFTAADLTGLVEALEQPYDADLGEFLSSGCFVLYLEATGYDPAAVTRCRAAVTGNDGPSCVQNLRAMFGDSDFSVFGEPISDIDSLAALLPRLSWEQVTELAQNPAFHGWLYRNHCGEIADQLRRVQ
jgi:hypothetical protein